MGGAEAQMDAIIRYDAIPEPRLAFVAFRGASFVTLQAAGVLSLLWYALLWSGHWCGTHHRQPRMERNLCVRGERLCSEKVLLCF